MDSIFGPHSPLGRRRQGPRCCSVCVTPINAARHLWTVCSEESSRSGRGATSCFMVTPDCVDDKVIHAHGQAVLGRPQLHSTVGMDGAGRAISARQSPRSLYRPGLANLRIARFTTGALHRPVHSLCGASRPNHEESGVRSVCSPRLCTCLLPHV